MTAPDPAPLDGLGQLLAMREAGRGAPIGETLGFTLVKVERGRAVFEGTPDRTVYNPIGSVHGGYAATLLDSACGIAVHSQLVAGQGYTTLELKIAYHRGLSDRSGTVRAEGRVVTMGRRVAFAEATLVDGEGRLCASATSTLLVFDLPACPGSPMRRGAIRATPPRPRPRTPRCAASTARSCRRSCAARPARSLRRAPRDAQARARRSTRRYCPRPARAG